MSLKEYAVDVDKINIEFKNDTKGKIVITNQLGQIVKESKISDNNVTINIEELPSGIYHVNVFNKRKLILNEKIVKTVF